MATKRKRKETIEQYRIDRLLALGFTMDHATRLAYAKDNEGHLIDRYKIEKMVEDGCPKELVVQILT